MIRSVTRAAATGSDCPTQPRISSGRASAAVEPADPGGQFCDRGKAFRAPVSAKRGKQGGGGAGAKGAPPGRSAAAYHQDDCTSPDGILARFGPRQEKNACDL